MFNRYFEKLNKISKKEEDRSNVTLEQSILENLHNLNFSKGLGDDARTLIEKIKEHHYPTYLHMLRVAKASYLVDVKLNKNNGKLEFIGGLLHDIGKLDIEPDKIMLYGGITDEEYEKIKKHSFLGYEKLKDDYVLTALVVGGHHSFVEYGYGINEKDFPDFVRKNPILCRRVIDAVRTVAMADFADAGRTRKTTERAGGDAPLKERMEKKFPGEEKKIEFLLNDPEVLALYE